MIQLAPHPLWLGNIADARDLMALHALGIQAIVQLAFEEALVAVSREMIVIRVPLLDGEGNSPADLQLAVGSVEQMLRDGRRTLVCCSAGMSRSPAVAAMALAKLAVTDADECLKEIHQLTATDVSPILWRDLQRACNFA